MPDLQNSSIRIALSHPAISASLPWLALLGIASCTGAANAPQKTALPTSNASTQCDEKPAQTSHEVRPDKEPTVNLGSFSVSLTVKDLATSRKFYETLGFEMIAGKPAANWILLKNGGTEIGLFQGMFDENLMTFNPTDARAIESTVQKAGYKLVKTTTGDTGPTSFIFKDPDGNTILIDQF